MKLHHALLAAGLLMPAAAEAHFQLIHVETPLIEAPGDVPVKLIFWHPFENGHVMDMGQPQAFYAVSRGEKIDLSASLKPFTFTGASNAAQGFDAVVPVTKAGDYVLVVEPAPYLEPSEDIFIQQFAKVYLNRMELPTDWAEPQGLPAEILPLVKPYNVIAGSTFTGRVLSEGQPVAGPRSRWSSWRPSPTWRRTRRRLPWPGRCRAARWSRCRTRTAISPSASQSPAGGASPRSAPGR